MYRSLLNSPGWDKLVEIVEKQVNNRAQQSIFAPRKSIDECVEMQYTHGEIAGMMMVIEFPKKLLHDINLTIEQLKETTDESE